MRDTEEIPAPRPEMTTTQKAAVSEGLAAALLTAASGGRLAPYLPLADDHGADMIVLDKDTGAALPVQVKSWMVGPGHEGNAVQFDVRRAAVHEAHRTALLAMTIEQATLGLDAAWLLPMTDVPAIATTYPDKYALAPSRSRDSADKYEGYRVHDAAALAERLIGLVNR